MRNKGVTLIELIITLSIIGILVALTAPTFLSDWKQEEGVKTNTRGLLDDLKWAQAEAQKQGSVSMEWVEDGGSWFWRLRRRMVFVVFDETNNGYSVWRWQDEDGDGLPGTGELNPDFDNTSPGAEDNAVKTESLEDGTSFGYDPSVVDTACSNSGGSAPGSPFSASISTPSLEPCNGSPCILFDSKGFMVGEPGQTIYITDNKYSYAISGNLAGIFKTCKWVEDEWQMIRG